jgi:tRNA-dihydrouridine synthase B
MAGITDEPFRKICRRFGAGATTAEMLTANWQMWQSKKSAGRLPRKSWPEPRIVQIAGADATQMAEASKRCVDGGAQIIDINMGCPAKKVCNKAAGSALLKNEALVRQILQAVVRATTVPVTLKIRTGWDRNNRNAPLIAAIAEDSGIAAVAIHGRTKACSFRGHAEYDTIKEVVAGISIPVFANGDITSPEQAKKILDYTGAAGIMIGRGALGRPWLFGQIDHLLTTGDRQPDPDIDSICKYILEHLSAIRSQYDAKLAVALARKHVAAYLARLGCSRNVRRQFNLLQSTNDQDRYIKNCLSQLNSVILEQAA